MNISLFLFLRIILLSLTGILALINAFGQDVNIVGVIVLLLYLFVIFYYRPIEFANNLLFFVILITMLVGGALIENGTYLFEINAYSYWNGTFIVNLFFSLFFFEFLLVNISPNHSKIVLNINRFYIEIIIIACIGILYATFLHTGVPLFNGTHRTVYFSSIVPGYVNLIKGRLSFVCLVLGMYYFKTKCKRYLFYFILIVLYHILCSIKGGELLIILYCFYLPITLHYAVRYAEADKQKLYKKIRATLFFFVIGIFSIILINYQTVENYDSSTSAIQKIQKRIEAAGQVWWVINDNNQVPEKIRWDKFTQNFSADNSKFDQGMNELMNVVVPSKILDEWRSTEDRGRSLANGFPAIGYYYFGYTGVTIFLIIFGSIIIAIKRDILASFESGDVLSFLFLGPILELIIRVVAQGDINLFFEVRTYAIFVAYMAYSIMKKAVVRINN
ncbi:DUF6418 domain-containing protein [Enterobacter quasiroggenkampii]|uniref:DUF6418 domain-containing protein n=1 Tax=Enterobacter quasiroggenkampii TaxID=2497436 RepID=UPI0021CE4A2F|nr:hypothetical protein [Enterobacter quasiroggenkampii]